MKNKTIKTKAIEGLVSGKLKLRKVYKRPNLIQEYMDWCKESFDVEDLKQTWLTDVNNTFLLRTNTNYHIDIRAGYVLIDNRKYKFELDTKELGLDIDGDAIQTSMLNHAMVRRAGYEIYLNYKQIKILGEL